MSRNSAQCEVITHSIQLQVNKDQSLVTCAKDWLNLHWILGVCHNLPVLLIQNILNLNKQFRHLCGKSVCICLKTKMVNFYHLHVYFSVVWCCCLFYMWILFKTDANNFTMHVVNLFIHIDISHILSHQFMVLAQQQCNKNTRRKLGFSPGKVVMKERSLC